MRDTTKIILFGVLGGLAVGGLIGSATFGTWGGVVGSIFGVLIGGGTMTMVAKATVSASEPPGLEDEDSA